jgi:uncharacterized protein involved in outer membrane biogenesis
MRLRHKILLGTTLLVVGVVVALGIAIATLDLDAYKAEATQRFHAATGRELHIDGGVELDVSLVPSIILEDVRIANAPWGSAPDMLRVARAEARLALLPLLGGEIKLRRLALSAPTILIEEDVSGVSNWNLRTGQPAPAQTGEAAPGWRGIALEELEIRDAGLHLRDSLTGTSTRISIGEISFATDGPGRPVKVAIAADVDGRELTVDGTLGRSGQFFANEAVAVDLDVTAGTTTVAIDGSVARPLQGEGLDLDLDLRAASLADLGRFAGGDWSGAGPVALTGQLTDTGQGHALNGFELRLAETSLSGNLRLDRDTGRPRLTGRLYAERIDLPSLGSGGEATTPERRLFPSTPLPLSALAALDADITLDARRVDTGQAPLQNLETRLRLDSGGLRIEPFTADVAGGRMQAVATLTAGDDAARAKLDLDIRQLEPGRLPGLRDAVTGAPTDLTFEAAGEGASFAAIMASLDGRLLAQSGPGSLNNSKASAASSDLLLETYRLLDPTASRDTRTRLDCAVFHFTIRDGVALTDRGIALATARMNVIGSGVIDLETERLDIGITTEAREGVGLSAGQFADLVRLGGTLANPRPTLDTGKTVMTGVSAGAAVATSGLSIVAQGLYDRLTADDAPCETALAMRVEDTRSSGERASEAVKQVGESIKGAFESLFGN